MPIKKIMMIIGLITGLTTVCGLVYKGVTGVNSTVGQIHANTQDIRNLENSVEFDKLCSLYRKALSDYYYWEAECSRTKLQKSCQAAEEAKRRLNRLEKQLEELEKKTGEICQ